MSRPRGARTLKPGRTKAAREALASWQGGEGIDRFMAEAVIRHGDFATIPALAVRAGLNVETVSRMLNGSQMGRIDSWTALLRAAGIELAVYPAAESEEPQIAADELDDEWEFDV